MKEEFYVQMNLGKTAKNEPILKMGKVGYHYKAPRKKEISLKLWKYDTIWLRTVDIDSTHSHVGFPTFPG